MEISSPVRPLCHAAPAVSSNFEERRSSCPQSVLLGLTNQQPRGGVASVQPSLELHDRKGASQELEGEDGDPTLHLRASGISCERANPRVARLKPHVDQYSGSKATSLWARAKLGTQVTTSLARFRGTPAPWHQRATPANSRVIAPSSVP